MGSRPSTFTLTKPGPLRLYSTQELLRLPPPTWLVQDILPSGGLVGLYGQPGHYKSFVAIDIAMSVATGIPWHGQQVKPGHVIYVAAEGGVGIAKRAKAWLLQQNMRPETVNLAWLTESIPVSVDSENMNLLFGRINDELSSEPTLVVIDTLARCFDGDENLQEDMGRFIGGVDRLRREFDATVIVVHHTRLGADRERGSTAFRGAADTMISCKLTAPGQIEIACDKQKDAEEFLTRTQQRKKIPEADSIVMIEPDTDRSGQIIELIRAEPAGISFTDLKARAYEAHGWSPATLKRKLVSLVKTGKIIRENGIYVLKS